MYILLEAAIQPLALSPTLAAFRKLRSWVVKLDPVGKGPFLIGGYHHYTR